MNKDTYEQKLLKLKESAARKESRLRKRIELAKGKPVKLGINTLKKELKRITHKIVRLTYDNCYSCDKYLQPSDRQAGHYHTDGGNPGTRYDFDNLRTQCAQCNYHKGGDAHYGARLLREIGQERIDRLDNVRKIKPGWKQIELETMIAERQILLDNLLKQNAP